MPAISFKKQFAEKVKTGEKRQTVRAYRKDGRDPKPGDMLYLYTGMRTKNCKKLKEVVCQHIKDVIIDKGMAYINSFPAVRFERDDFAKADGFNNFKEMEAFFSRVHGLPFYGLLIGW